MLRAEQINNPFREPLTDDYFSEFSAQKVSRKDRKAAAKKERIKRRKRVRKSARSASIVSTVLMTWMVSSGGVRST